MDILERSWELQEDIEKSVKHIGKGRYGRILKMARKPNQEEYSKTVKITGLGIILIGGLGFLIWWLWTYVPEYLSTI